MVFDCVEDRASPTNASVGLQDGELRQPVDSLMTWTEEERRRRNPCPPDTRTVQSRLRDEESVTHWAEADRKSTRLNSSHRTISYAVFCLKKKKQINTS